jgi:hypothetical protein
MVAGRYNQAQDVAQLGLIFDEPQQGVTASSPLTDAKDIFGGGVHADDQEVLVKKNDAGTQAVEDVAGIPAYGTVVAGSRLSGSRSSA